MALRPVCAERQTDARGLHALERDVRHRHAALPLLVVVVVVQEAVGVLDRAVAQDDAPREVADRVRAVRVVGEEREHVVAPEGRAGRRRHAGLLLLLREGAAEAPLAGALDRAAFDQHVVAAKAERAAGRVDEAVAHRHAMVVEPRKAVVARLERAVLYQHVVAPVEMHGIMPAEARHAVEREALHVREAVRPVAGVVHCVAPEGQVRAVDGVDAERAAIELLSRRVVGVGPVDETVRLADDRRIRRLVEADERVVPAASRIAPDRVLVGRVALVPALVRDDLRIDRLDRVPFEDVVFLDVARAEQPAARFQVERDAAAQAQAADLPRALREPHRAAARAEAVVDCALDGARRVAFDRRGADGLPRAP